MCVGIGSGVTLIKVTCTASSFLCAYGEHGFCMDWILRLSLRSAYGVHNFLENTKFQECVWSAWILVCKWSPGSAFGVRTFQQKKMWECVGVRRSALKDSQVRLECALLTHCYALQTHFSTARVVRCSKQLYNLFSLFVHLSTVGLWCLRGAIAILLTFCKYIFFLISFWFKFWFGFQFHWNFFQSTWGEHWFR